MIKFDFKKYCPISDSELVLYQTRKEDIKAKFLEEDNMKGWYNLDITAEEIADINKTASQIRNSCNVFLVIGIGGSFLGAKAIYDMMAELYKKQAPEIIFVGTTYSTGSLLKLEKYLKDKEVMINVISKSGNTLETNLAFEEIYHFLENKYSEAELSRRIIVTTNANSGKLLDFVKAHNTKHFIVPTDVGGRFSVLTCVGLLPLAVYNIDIEKMLDGAKECKKSDESAYYYASLRDILYRKGKKIEAYTVYDDKLIFFTEWLKQLFGETQGKNKKGLFPVSLLYSRDLHSLGQYLQDGESTIFETHIKIDSNEKINISKYNTSLSIIEELMQESVCESHLENGNPSLLINLDGMTEWNIGYMVFFFFLSSMFGAYLLDVPYYNQPGVENYKEKLEKKLNKKGN